MVETPATVITIDHFMEDVDFFSIGTNDLLQYTMATDRSNRNVSDLYEQEAPALLRMIREIVKAAQHYGKPVSLCGQMGSVPHNIPLLIGLGLRSISVTPMILHYGVCESYWSKIAKRSRNARCRWNRSGRNCCATNGTREPPEKRRSQNRILPT